MKLLNLWRSIAIQSTLIAALGMVAPRAQAAIDVVVSIPELGALAKEVGGEDVNVYSIARPNNDYHAIEMRPSDVARLNRAELVVRTGLGLDIWFDALSRATGNTRVRAGGSGYVDASSGIPTIEKPTESISGSSGDVHPAGNPHYYYDPVYGIYAARNILRGLLRVDAKNADEYRANYARFRADMQKRTATWQNELKPFAGRSIVTYHRNYNYFLRRFGIRQYGTMEPRPGIPPSARHINELLASMKRDKVKAILVESIYPMRYPNLVARQVGSTAVVGPFSVASLNVGAYANMIDTLVERTKQAIRQ